MGIQDLGRSKNEGLHLNLNLPNFSLCNHYFSSVHINSNSSSYSDNVILEQGLDLVEETWSVVIHDITTSFSDGI